MKWRIQLKLFSTGDRKVETHFEVEDFPTADQMFVAHGTLVELFNQLRNHPSDRDAQPHRVVIEMTPLKEDDDGEK